MFYWSASRCWSLWAHRGKLRCIINRCLTQQVNIIRFVHDDYTSAFIRLRDDDVVKSFQLLYSPLKWFWRLRRFALDVIKCNRSKGRGGQLFLVISKSTLQFPIEFFRNSLVYRWQIRAAGGRTLNLGREQAFGRMRVCAMRCFVCACQHHDPCSLVSLSCWRVWPLHSQCVSSVGLS